MTFLRSTFFIWHFAVVLIIFLSGTAQGSCGACFIPHEGGQGLGTGAENISSAPMINSPTAATLGRNHVSGGFTFDYLRFNSIPAANAHDLHHEGRDIHGKDHEEIYSMHAGYGLFDDADIYLAAPVVSRSSIQIHSHSLLGAHEHATGFGDMRLIGKYRFWKRWFESALMAGVKFPAGQTAVLGQGGSKFEPEQQPGSGSWDGEFALIASRRFGRRYSAATSFQYALRGEGAQGHKLGDIFQFNIGSSLGVRESGHYPNVSLVLELSNRWARKDHSRLQDRVFDSGGVTIFISPGLNLDLVQHVTAFWAMPIPIYQNLGGEHEELKFEMLAGLSIHA